MCDFSISKKQTKDTTRQQSFYIWLISMNIYEDDYFKDIYNNLNQRGRYYSSAQKTNIDKPRHNW